MYRFRRQTTLSNVAYPTIVISIISVVVILIACILLSGPILGTFPFGPTETKVITVQRMWVDVSKNKDSSSSHYMVSTTDGEVFEVQNSIWLWSFNADTIYGALKEGETFTITSKGNRIVNFFLQEYPSIINVPTKMDE